MAWGQELPQVALTPQQEQEDEQLRATAAFMVGLPESRMKYKGLPRELFVELLGYMLPGWAYNGPGNA